MKKLYILVGVVTVAVLAAGGLLLVHGNSNATNSCNAPTKSRHYTAVITEGKVTGDHIVGKLCDSLTITNRDNVSREIAFGPHEDHVPYDGVAERVLNKGQSLTVTFNQTGSFHWHDHLHDEIEGFFAVSK